VGGKGGETGRGMGREGREGRREGKGREGKGRGRMHPSIGGIRGAVSGYNLTNGWVNLGIILCPLDTSYPALTVCEIVALLKVAKRTVTGNQ
jgi:hypothetical protein